MYNKCSGKMDFRFRFSLAFEGDRPSTPGEWEFLLWLIMWFVVVVVQGWRTTRSSDACRTTCCTHGCTPLPPSGNSLRPSALFPAWGAADLSPRAARDPSGGPPHILAPWPSARLPPTLPFADHTPGNGGNSGTGCRAVRTLCMSAGHRPSGPHRRR